MALWQFDVDLIPRTKVLELFAMVPQSIETEVFEETEWWKGYQLSSAHEQILDQCLARYTPSWRSNSQEWGAEDGNRVSIGVLDDSIDWIWIRIDVRDVSSTLLECLVKFAKEVDAVLLVIESMSIIEPDKQGLRREILGSNAFRFVADPEKYIKDFDDNRRRAQPEDGLEDV